MITLLATRMVLVLISLHVHVLLLIMRLLLLLLIMLVLLPWWRIVSGGTLRMSTTGLTLEWVLTLILTLGSGIQGTPGPGASLIHLVSPPGPLCQISFVRRNIHTAVPTLMTLTIRSTHVRNGPPTTIQTGTADAQVVRREARGRRSGAGQLYTLVRKFQRLRKCDANRIVCDDRFSKQIVMT